VLDRTLEPDPPLSRDAVAALSTDVTELFTGIITGLRAQLERAY
jgi:hypothetical protein